MVTVVVTVVAGVVVAPETITDPFSMFGVIRLPFSSDNSAHVMVRGDSPTEIPLTVMFAKIASSFPIAVADMADMTTKPLLLLMFEVIIGKSSATTSITSSIDLLKVMFTDPPAIRLAFLIIIGMIWVEPRLI